MSTPAPRDYPVGPLCAAASRDVTASALMDLVGLNGPDARRAIETGLTEWQADRAACRLGLHPVEVWPMWTVLPLVDALIERDRARLERWVRRYVTRHRLDSCSRAAGPPRAARRDRTSVAAAAPPSP